MARTEKLEVEVVATDKASGVLNDVAGKVDKIDGSTAEVSVEADDGEINALFARIDKLTDEDQVVILKAKADELKREVDKATKLLGKLDGETFDAVLAAKDQATADIRQVQDKLDIFDKRTADATLDTTDSATGDIKQVGDKLDTFDKKTVDATLDTDDKATGDIRDVTDRLDTYDKKSVDAEIDVDPEKAKLGIADINAALGNAPGGLGRVAGALTTKAGAITLIGAGLLAAGDNAADLAIQAGTLAGQFNSTPEMVSGLAAVLRTTADVEATDLADIIGQMASSMASTPGLAETFGLTLDQVRADPVAAFIQAVDNIAADGKFSFEELKAASVAFGEEGVRQVAAVVAMVGPEGLSGAIEDLPDAVIITAADVRQAQTFKREMNELKATLGGIVQDIGAPILEVLSPIISLIGEAASLIPTLTDPLTSLISGEQTVIGEIDAELSNFINLLRAGKTDVEAWQLAFGNTEGLDAHTAAVQTARDMIAQGMPIHEAMAEVFGINEENALLVADAYGLLTEATDESTGVTAESEAAVAKLNAEIDAQVEAVNEQTRALEESIDKLEEMAGAQQDTAGSYLDVREATRDAADEVDHYNEVMADSESTDRDKARALDNVVRGAADLADATVEAARTQATANGTTLSATAALDIQNKSLLTQAAQLTGPLRAALITHIAQLNGIPPDIQSQIQVLIDQGDIAGAEKLLNETSRARAAYVNAAIDQASVNATEDTLNWLARQRSAAIIAQYGGIGEYGYYAYARGTKSAKRGVALVGEQGPELVAMSGGEQVYPAGQTQAMLNGNGATGAGANGWSTQVVNHFTINVPTGTNPADTLNQIRRYERIQGPAL